MSEWKSYKLENIAQIISTKTNISNATLENYISTENMVNDFGGVVKANKLPNSPSVNCFLAEDILFSNIRTYFKKVWFAAFEGTVSPDVLVFRARKNLCHNRYLFYAFCNPDFTEYSLLTSKGAKMPRGDKDALKEYLIFLPELKEQNAIVSILSSLDDKIDLLHRQNTTLEKMAETLFRQWFVQEAKEEWEKVKIKDLFEIRDGTHDSPKQKELGKKLITSKHLSKHSIDFESAYYISEEDFEQINRRSKVDTGDILFSMIGTIGIIYLEQSVKIDYAIKNIGLFKTSQNSFWTYFTLLWLKSDLGNEFIYENRSGSTQEYISLGSLRSIYFSIPSLEIIKQFNKEVEPLFQKIKANQAQIRILTALRDTLLPKLMSGEVRINV